MRPGSNPGTFKIDAKFITIVSKLLVIFRNDSQKVAAWIVTPNLNLGGMAPLKIMAQGRHQKVSEFIDLRLQDKIVSELQAPGESTT